MSFRRLAASLLPFLAALALAACSSGGTRPPAPPSASIQKLVIGTDGSLALEMRVQNYAEKAVHFAELDATLTLDGVDAGAIQAPIAFDIPGRNSEIVTAKLAAPAMREKLMPAGGADARHEVRYQLKGTLVTDKPANRWPFHYSSALSPVPGVANEYR